MMEEVRQYFRRENSRQDIKVLVRTFFGDGNGKGA